MFIRQKENNTRLDFIQNIEFMVIELLSIDFVNAADDIVRILVLTIITITILQTNQTSISIWEIYQTSIHLKTNKPKIYFLNQNQYNINNMGITNHFQSTWFTYNNNY